MSKTAVHSGDTLSGATFSSGTTVVVANGGTLDKSFVASGATLDLRAHADANHISVGGIADVHTTVDRLLVSSGGVVNVYAHGNVSGGVVSSGSVFVNSGTVTSLSIRSGSTITQFGGHTSNTVVHSGAVQTVLGGTAMSTFVHTGGELVVSGGDVRHVGIGDGAQADFDGGEMAGVIRSGGTLLVFQSGANLSGLTARDGATVVLVGAASADGLTIDSGATVLNADVLTFTPNGAASLATIGYQQAYDPTQAVVAYQGADQAFTISGGSFTLSAGAENKGGMLSDVTETVLTGAGDRDSKIQSGTQILAGGQAGLDQFKDATQIVGSGGSAISSTLADTSFQVIQSGGFAETTLGRGVIDDRGGTLTSTTLLGATLVFDAITATTLIDVAAGSGAEVVVLGSSLTLAPGSLTIGSGATLLEFGGATLAGATIDTGASVVTADVGVFTNGDGAVDPISAANTLTGLALHDQTMRVWAGGSAIATHIDTAGAVIVSGGFLSGTRVFSGGTLTVSGGTVSDTRVHASGLIVVDGGTITDTTVQRGDLMVSGGSADVTSVLSGGMMTIGAAGSVDGLTVNEGGLVVDSGGALTDVFLRVGGTLDMTSFLYAPGGGATLNASDVLTVREHGHLYTLQMSGSYGGTAFGLSADGSGGTLITVSAVSAASAGAATGGELVRGGGFAVLSAATVKPAAPLGAGASHQTATIEPFNHLLPHAQ